MKIKSLILAALSAAAVLSGCATDPARMNQAEIAASNYGASYFGSMANGADMGATSAAAGLSSASGQVYIAPPAQRAITTTCRPSALSMVGMGSGSVTCTTY